jgi:hypothetical protein
MVELIPKLLTVFFQLSICINYYKKVGIGELHKLFQSQNYSGRFRSKMQLQMKRASCKNLILDAVIVQIKSPATQKC